MTETMSFKDKLQVVGNIFFICMILGFSTLFLAFFAMIFLGDFIYDIQSMFFKISKEHFQMSMYSIMTGYKSLILLFFTFPWISIKLVLKKLKN